MFFSYTSYYLAIAAIPLALAMLSGFFYAVNAVCTRKFGIHESRSSLVFYPILTYLLFIGLLWMAMGDGRFATEENKNMAFLARSWKMPGNTDLLFLLVLGFVAAAGTYCLSQAYRITDASVVAPFEYLAIPISVGWGYLFWKEVPGRIQILDILMIIAGGIYVLKKRSLSPK
jgi:drug/metabolite transporter (DMT)-like permease